VTTVGFEKAEYLIFKNVDEWLHRNEFVDEKVTPNP